MPLDECCQPQVVREVHVHVHVHVHGRSVTYD